MIGPILSSETLITGTKVLPVGGDDESDFFSDCLTSRFSICDQPTIVNSENVSVWNTNARERNFTVFGTILTF
jgi:hypothetical protein